MFGLDSFTLISIAGAVAIGIPFVYLFYRYVIRGKNTFPMINNHEQPDDMFETGLSP